MKYLGFFFHHQLELVFFSSCHFVYFYKMGCINDRKLDNHEAKWYLNYIVDGVTKPFISKMSKVQESLKQGCHNM